MRGKRKGKCAFSNGQIFGTNNWTLQTYRRRIAHCQGGVAILRRTLGGKDDELKCIRSFGIFASSKIYLEILSSMSLFEPLPWLELTYNTRYINDECEKIEKGNVHLAMIEYMGQVLEGSYYLVSGLLKVEKYKWEGELITKSDWHFEKDAHNSLIDNL